MPVPWPPSGPSAIPKKVQEFLTTQTQDLQPEELGQDEIIVEYDPDSFEETVTFEEWESLQVEAREWVKMMSTSLSTNDRLVETYAWSTQVLEDTLDFSYERDHITWPMQVNQELCRRVEAIFDGVHDDLGLVDPQDSILKLSVENLYELLVSLKGVPISKSQYWFCVEAGHIIVHYRNRVKKAQAKITPPGIDNRPQRQAAQGLPARQKETLSGNKSKSAHASNGLRENPPKNETSSSSRSRAANASASKDSTIEKSRSSTTGDRRSSTIKEGEPSTARKGKDLGTTYSTRDRETKGIRGIKASGNMGSGSPSDKIHTKYSEHREYQRRPHRASKYEEPRRRPARPRDESSLYS